jgi:hypothetical protein
VNINTSEKFSAYCFVNFSVSPQVPDSLQLGNGLWMLSRLPIEISDHWRDGLGSWKLEDIERCNFVLVTTVPSQTPQNFDQENQDLTRRLKYLLYGLMLQRVPYYETGFSLSGANVDGDIQIRDFGELPEYVPSYDLPCLQVGVTEVKCATCLAEQLELIDHIGEGWARLRRGLKALFRGSQETEGGDRLHQFARALEALVKPDIGNTKTQFTHRAQTFALAGLETRNNLLQIFDIRSQVEHMHSPLNALDGTEEERIVLANRRTRQADMLARFAFSHLLESEQLLEVFRTDANIDAFWRIKDHDRILIWGDRLDLIKIP